MKRRLLDKVSVLLGKVTAEVKVEPYSDNWEIVMKDGLLIHRKKETMVPKQLIQEIITILQGVSGYWSTSNDCLPSQETVEQAIATLEDYLDDEFDMVEALNKAERLQE